MIFPFPDIWFNNKHGGNHSTVQSTLTSFKIENDIYATAISTENSIYHCKFINNEWVLHNDNGFAVKQGKNIWFFYNGTNFKVEDMPIDGEMKVILTLKHPLQNEYEQFTIYNDV
jgi:hypothetical protein